VHDDQYHTGDDVGKPPQDRNVMRPVGAGGGRLRRDHVPRCMVAALGVRLGAAGDHGYCAGRKALPQMTLGSKESLNTWLAMLPDMVRQGLRKLTLMTTDGPPDLIAAVE
jgi:transposase-like protein